ncbi:Aste57867_144 [Aphanomyces stellatus]|uniref:Aste57867_144 protein n=1 Tax=Aphanomyces stellatus TaxID=120398 RepID=A0A485K4W1_9STRA|nr:hypothetical protein As57867_000144 [Aphanomyces stellatus]VFT77370.1 Aste57867_144 [Aphanomyces stellatus]
MLALVVAFANSSHKSSSQSSRKCSPMKSQSWLCVFKPATLKCHPLSTCCEKRMLQAAVSSTAPVTALEKATSSVKYKIVKKAALRKQRELVGCHRVPFYPLQNAYYRMDRHKTIILASIIEGDETTACESCQSHTFDSVPAVVAISFY